jgi:hypothetical protein
VVAAPLYRAGGYRLVGWVSVAVALVQGVLAWSLPAARPVAVVEEEADSDDPAIGFWRRYAQTLRAGLTEAAHRPGVRHAVLILAMLYSFLVYDEYFPLVAREHGTATADIPVVMALTVAGQAVGTALAGRTARWRNATLGWGLAAAALLLGAGAISGRTVGFVGIAIGYGIVTNAIVVADARLQDAISGRARATVTSASGLLSEVFAVALYAGFAIGSPLLAVSTMMAMLTLPLLGVSRLVPRWLPVRKPQRKRVA